MQKRAPRKEERDDCVPMILITDFNGCVRRGEESYIPRHEE